MVIIKSAKSRWYIFLLLSLLGFPAGFALPKLLHMGTGSYVSYFSIYGLSVYQTTNIKIWNLFHYIAKHRLLIFLFLWMSCFTSVGFFLHTIYGLWTSVSLGMLVALFLLRGGINGIWLCMICILPQWLFYFLAIKMNLQFLQQKMSRLSGVPGYTINLIHKQEIQHLVKLMIICVSGCLVETILGHWTIKIILQLMDYR